MFAGCPKFRHRSVCAAGRPAKTQVSRSVGLSGSDRGFPVLTGRSGTQRARCVRVLDAWHHGALVLVIAASPVLVRGTHYCPAQTPPPNPTAAGLDGRRVLSRVGVADHEVTPEAPWTGSGWREHSCGGFGGGCLRFYPHVAPADNPRIKIRPRSWSRPSESVSPVTRPRWSRMPCVMSSEATRHRCCSNCCLLSGCMFVSLPSFGFYGAFGTCREGPRPVRAAAASPLCSDRSVRSGSRVKRDVA